MRHPATTPQQRMGCFWLQRVWRRLDGTTVLHGASLQRQFQGLQGTEDRISLNPPVFDFLTTSKNTFEFISNFFDAMNGRKLLHVCDEEPKLSPMATVAPPIGPPELGPNTVYQPQSFQDFLAQRQAATPAGLLWDERRLEAEINIKSLYCTDRQRAGIEAVHRDHKLEKHVFHLTASSQEQAQVFLRKHGLDTDSLKKLERRWTISHTVRWERKSTGQRLSRILYQCSTGYDTAARQLGKAKSPPELLDSSKKEWQHRAPYDHTECLAHAEVTTVVSSGNVLRVAGYFEHNEDCKNAVMKRFPAVPLHPDVYNIALQQLRQGAGITEIQSENLRRLQAKAYQDQPLDDGMLANYRFNLLSGDFSRLYRIHYRDTHKVDLSARPEHNVDNWLNSESSSYKPHLHRSVFHYTPRGDNGQRLKVCIATPEMKDAAWKYCHKKQVMIDGTFGLSTSRLLVWIALGVDESNRGIPVAMFLFSAPTGNRATHAGYDTQVIAEIMTSWRDWMGERAGEKFALSVALTDTDSKERGGLVVAWEDILLLLCKFHVRQCWTNKRNSCLGKTDLYCRRYLDCRFHTLEEALLDTVEYNDATRLIAEEEKECSFLATQSDGKKIAEGGLAYLAYLTKTWMPIEMWRSWSHRGREEAAQRLGIPIDGVIPTTNHLEALNRNLKHKYIPQWQHSGHRLRFDVLIYHLTTSILPHIYAQHRMLLGYSTWRQHRFLNVSGGQAPRPARALSPSTLPFIPRTWYAPDASRDMAARDIFATRKLWPILSARPYELWAQCEVVLTGVLQRIRSYFHLLKRMQSQLKFTTNDEGSDNRPPVHMRVNDLTQSAPILPPPTHQHQATLIDLEREASRAATFEVLSEESLMMVADSSNSDEESDTQGTLSAAQAQSIHGQLSELRDINIAVIQLQEQQRTEHDILQILPRLHGIINTLKNERTRLHPNKDIYEFRDAVNSVSRLLDNKLAMPSVFGQGGSNGGNSEIVQEDDVRGREQTNSGSGKRRASPRALSPERKQKHHKSYSTM
ncbi:hypothetical protein NM688_g8115 [Phlebia brevispora]|uniref:Uncharacterized protein n=1 Tax=Phlebia brevispora TaxID=194682 RepID=A0ACC1RX46_9APHY|nr:hypothetical protein NM688_g8115 [Phlebia brevispora]